MGEHINISSAWTVIYLRGTVRPVSTSAPKRVMDVEWGFMFLGEGFRGLRHPWLKKEMDCLQIFHYYTVLTVRVTSQQNWDCT
ncbi:hypothetical protein FQN60_015364 [Etheostoma spectabile]|uniref:Uncharacterized protein n=1 Tax=Etheostoma spectabile TaxID=54343 RepID=A0A5J5CAK3_9PERO|nr:hypothetical protein FQN60_015364 [Etheostoma spectabile]